MSRFNKLSHAIWHCKYLIVWTPKYRYRMLKGAIKEEGENCLSMFSEQKRCKLDQMNVQDDHVHIIVAVPPKVSISELVGGGDRFKC